ncbi:MAG: glucose 1-dehydrogenase, partial [Betaproteobacteria bacterium]
MNDLEGKLALVTGGAKGIGKVIATKLAARGAHVIVNFFHSLEEAKRTRDELTATGATVEILRASVSREDQVARMFADIAQRHGHLDILINNAAAGAMVPMDQVTEEYFDRALGTNLKGAFWCARHASVLMAKRGGGTIVNLSSIGASLAVPNYTVVGTSKAALEALTRYLAAEYASLNIRVNGASAGLVDTDVVQHFPDHAKMRQRIVESTPLGRVATPDDLADVVMFLTSDASRWIVGQTILADGGMSLGTSAFVGPSAPLRESTALELTAGMAAASSEIKPAPSIAAPKEDQTRLVRDAAAVSSRRGLVLIDGTTMSSRVAERQPVPSEALESEDIAIVGMGVALPGAWDPSQFWDNLMQGPDLFEKVPSDRWNGANFHAAQPSVEDKTYSLYSAFVKGASPLAAMPSLTDELEDGSVRWLRHSLQQAMQGVQQKDDDRVSFVVGYTPDGNQCLEESYVARGIGHRFREILASMPGGSAQNEPLAKHIEDSLQTRYSAGTVSPAAFLPDVSGRKAMQGILPAATELLMVDTACSSSLYAVDIGVKGLIMGKCDVAVCGGAFALAPLNGVLFSKLGGLARGSAVRSLDKDSDGVLFSDGAGVVVLKRLARAQKDGDRIYGVIKACASSADGKGKAIYAPALEGQRLALRRAHAHPGYQGAEVDWVLAHATGTPAGDRTELESLRSAFSNGRKLLVTSNKSVIGHTGWAAGVASLIQAALAFEKNAIPPQHRFSSPPAGFPITDSSITIPTTAQPWLRNGKPRHAAISSF